MAFPLQPHQPLPLRKLAERQGDVGGSGSTYNRHGEDGCLARKGGTAAVSGKPSLTGTWCEGSCGFAWLLPAWIPGRLVAE